MAEFTIEYVKNKSDFLKTLENSDNLNLKNVQNYVPLYENFFVLNETNYNHINLNQRYHITSITDRPQFNTINCKLMDTVKLNEKEETIFVKFSPLLDPVKYLVGKYDHTDVNIFNLPKLDNKHICHSKIQNVFNSAYTDSFFSFLTSKLLNEHGFLHGLDFYGSYLANLNDYKVNIFDDIEYLSESQFFNSNKDSLFTIDENFYDMVCESDSRDRKKRLQFGKELKGNIDAEILVADNSSNKVVSNLSDFSTIEEIDNIISQDDSDKISRKTHSTCSSRSSHTDNSDNEDEDENSENDSDYDEEDSEEGSESITSSMDEDEDEDEEQVFAHIEDFPVDMICLESCKDTLDSYMMGQDVDPDEWLGILMQVIMQLIAYQKVFAFTHNDLHTNNIMYKETDKQYLYYCFNSVYYKVPTYGKIWKIIDFGRAIYKFDGKIICSDSFAPGEDAATQYNCEPFINPDKPRLDPNFSFDLCRLGCSLFDYFDCDLESLTTDLEDLDDVQEIIVDWCKDDKNKNILYKKNGEERYPEFKLYKMIARNVHNHTPINQLSREQFSQYKVSKKKIKKNISKVLDIDKLPDMSVSIGNDENTVVSINN